MFTILSVPLLSNIILAWFSTATASLPISCKSPYSATLGTCIYASQVKKTYCNAQSFCRSMEGELVTGDVVPRLLKTSDYGNLFKEGRWIGATDMLDESAAMERDDAFFRYTDGRKTSKDDFGSNQPNNGGSRMSPEDCAVIREESIGIVITLSSKLKIYDISCSKSLYFLCQKSPVKSRDKMKFHAKGNHVVKTSSSACTSRLHAKIENICALACFERAGCVSFYYKVAKTESENNCLLIDHTDATLTEEEEKDYTSRYTTQNNE